jgi:hypothetical protein
MRLVVRKLDVVDLGHLQSLVIEHIDGVEPGLTVLDSRLLLGHATVDVVALDAEGGLVLASVGFNADEEMLLKAVETYSWCLEYPEAIKRLYPAVEVSAARPPRLMFVVERLPDAFHRKIKQLGFCEVDCVEFRHLDVSGTPAVYFDTIARLRRGSALAEFQPAPIARRVSEREPRRAPEPLAAESTPDKIADHSDKVVPFVSGPGSTRATSVRLQKMLNANGPGHGHGATPVIDLATRTATTTRAESARVEAPKVEALRVEAAAPRVEPIRVEPVQITTARVEARVEPIEPEVEVPAEDAEPTLALPALELPTLEMPTLEMPTLEAAIPAAEAPEAVAVEFSVDSEPEPAPQAEAPISIPEPIARMTLRGAIPVPAPVAVAEPAPTAEPKLSLAGIANELLGALTPKTAPEKAAVVEQPAPVAPAPTPFKRVAKPAAPAAQPATPAAQPAAPATKPVVPGLKPITPDKPIAPAPKPIAPVAKPAAAAPKPATPTTTSPAATPSTPAAPKPAVAATPAAPKPAVATTPGAVKPAVAATPAAAAPAPKPAASETPAQNLPQEFEGLKFPNDGVLTRQWMEFLNQMASSK